MDKNTKLTLELTYGELETLMEVYHDFHMHGMHNVCENDPSNVIPVLTKRCRPAEADDMRALGTRECIILEKAFNWHLAKPILERSTLGTRIGEIVSQAEKEIISCSIKNKTYGRLAYCPFQFKHLDGVTVGAHPRAVTYVFSDGKTNIEGECMLPEKEQITRIRKYDRLIVDLGFQTSSNDILRPGVFVGFDELVKRTYGLVYDRVIDSNGDTVALFDILDKAL